MGGRLALVDWGAGRSAARYRRLRLLPPRRAGDDVVVAKLAAPDPQRFDLHGGGDDERSGASPPQDHRATRQALDLPRRIAIDVAFGQLDGYRAEDSHPAKTRDD